MAILPAEIPTGIVTGQFYFVSEDNVDADTNPELTVVAGDVTFTCTATSPLRMPTKLATVIPLEFKAKFNAQGQLVSESDETLGIQLPATDSPLFNPTGFTWKVTFDIVQVENRHTVKIDPFEFQVPEGEIVDLTLVMPVDASPGVLTVQGPQGIQGPIGTPVTLTVNETITGAELPGTPGPQGIQGPIGPKGDPGGFTDGTELGTSNLNSVLTPGIYKQTTSANTTTANNYPFTGVMAIMTVFKARPTDVLQIIEPGNGIRAGSVSWKRASADNGATWSVWKAVASTRVDQTAGRAIYQWDELNNREQIIYGDTGDRNITSLGNGTFAALKIRRVGSVVHVVCINWVPSTNGAGLFSAALPIGWRNNNTHHFVAIDNGTLRAANMGASASNIVVGGNTTTSSISFYLTFTTLDAWPTTLIGVAGDGGIPNL